MGTQCLVNTSAIIMKFLVVAALVSQSFALPQGFYGLVTHLDGSVVPLDEPRVAAAKADHLATKYGTVAAALPAVPAVPAVHAAVAAAVPAVPAVHAVPAAPVVQHAVQYAGPIHVPSLVAHPNGAVVPVDEPAVAAARAEHLQAHGVAVPAAAYAYAPTGYAGYAGYAGYYGGLVAHPNGAVVPVDEPAVVAARAQHFAAKAAAGH